MKIDRLEEAWKRDVDHVLSEPLPWQDLAGQRILVSGAGGFLGGYVARTLLWLNHTGRLSAPITVVAACRNSNIAAKRFERWRDDPHFELLEWDLNSIAVPPVGDVNTIVHAASQASPVYYDTDPVGTMLPNTVGTAALLEVLRHSTNPKAFLFVSSSEVYGSVKAASGLRETDCGTSDPATVRACYSEAKRLGETCCVAYHHQYGLQTYIVRPFHTYGPGVRPDDGRVFADFAFSVMRNESIRMNSTGDAVRAFCYASDAISGFMTVLLKGKCATPYNVANPSAAMSISQLAEMLVGLYPEKSLRVQRNDPNDSTPYVASTFNRLVPDTGRLEALGWSPKIAPKEGFTRMIEASR